MKNEKSPAGVEHRGLAWAVSESLWRTAAVTADDLERPWLDKMTVGHPDGGGPPRIHIIADSVIGSGEKIVADREAEARRWLLAAYPRQALGLEMESYASLRACRFFDTPFLVAKASVDKATIKKDDRWRVYACQLSAAFLLTVLQRYDQPRRPPHASHQRMRGVGECNRRQAPSGRLRLQNPHGGFFRATPAGYLRGGGERRDALFPTDLHPNVVLYGGGGAGKTTIMRRLFRDLFGAAYTPVLIDLKRYSQEYAEGGAEDIDSILNVATSPRRTSQEIEQLAVQRKLVVLIDGVNEVSRTALASVRAFCQDLRRGPGCYTIWFNRMTLIQDLRPDPSHATVGRVPKEVAERLFDNQFGQGKFASLTDRLREIFQRPFFLDLAIREKTFHREPASGARFSASSSANTSR